MGWKLEACSERKRLHFTSHGKLVTKFRRPNFQDERGTQFAVMLTQCIGTDVWEEQELCVWLGLGFVASKYLA